MFDTFQDGGAHVVGVDDGNDHILSVWEWENKKKVAEAKVRPRARFFIVVHAVQFMYCTYINGYIHSNIHSNIQPLFKHEKFH